MKQQIYEILIKHEGYSPHSAEVTANDLISIKDAEITQALIQWVSTGEKTDLVRGKYSSRRLMEGFHMTYPASLIFLDWYCEDPQSAVTSLQYGGGLI